MNKTNKIALLCSYPESLLQPGADTTNHSYVGAWLVSLSQQFAELNIPCEFHWLIPSKNVSSITTIEQNNQFFHLYPRLKKTIGLFTGYYYERKQVRSILNAIQPDLVHSWGTEDCHAVTAADYKGHKLLSIQGLLTAYNKRSRLPFFERRQIFWEQYAIKRFRQITTESPWSRQELLELKPDAEVSLVDYTVESIYAGQTRHLSPAPSFLYAGTLREIKGLDILVAAFSTEELSHATLRIAGCGSPEFVESLKRQSTPNIRFLGNLSRTELRDELSRAWGLVHPSYADTGPTIVKEARVMGLPVILTEDCGSKQYVSHGKSGFVIAPGSVRDIVDSVLHLSDSSERSLEMGRYEQDRCVKALTGSVTAERFVSLYEQIIFS